MNLIRKLGSVAVHPNRYRAQARGIPGLLILFPIFLIMVGLLVFAAGSERTQAQGPAQTLPSVKVAFIGDAGVGGDAKKVLELIKKQGADFVLHQGDFAYGDEDPAAARDWNDQVNEVLGADYPYFGSVGNHDNSAWSTYQGLFQDRLKRNPEVVCQGDYGVNTACHYQGIFFILSGVGIRGSGHVQFIEDQLAQDNSTWSICAWHKNQTAMQVGGKRDEAGWGAYEACREGGAIIATSHEHSYSRTKTLISMQSQTVDPEWPAPNDVRVTPGSTFAFVSGLGGHDVRDQERCRPTSYPYGCKGEWASIYTSNQRARSGALFITFNFEGDPNRAQGQFIDIKGKIIDEFMITAAGNNTAPVGDAQNIATDEDTARSVTLTGSDADGDSVSFSVRNGPDSGTLSGTAPNLTYLPDADFSGPDRFTFVANDGKTNSAPATVSITVKPVNDAPVANGQSVGVTAGKSRNITLTGGDVDGDSLVFKVLTSPDPAKGSLSGTPPNVTYTPIGGVTGPDEFTFSVNDGKLGISAATVSLTIAVDVPPVSNSQEVATTEDTARAITLTGKDANGDSLTFTVLSGPASGSLSGTAPNLTYAPRVGFVGSDSFTFRVNDGANDSPPATVGITVIRRIVGQGMKLSKNSDFSTTATVFNYGETVYLLAWSDRVDFDNIKKSEWKLEHMKGDLTNNHDLTYTGQVVNDENVKEVKPGKSTRGKVEIKVEDRNGRRIKISQSVTLNGPDA